MRNILVVDGSEQDRRLMAAGLNTAGFAVLLAESPVEALALADPERVGLIVSELVFSEGSGIALLRAFKERPETAALPFVLISAQAEIEDKIAALELGACDVLAKPIYLREFVTRLKAQLGPEDVKPRTRFNGVLGEGLVADVLKAALADGRSGTLDLLPDAEGQGGAFSLCFGHGKLVGRRAETLSPERVLRLALLRDRGTFVIDFHDLDDEAAATDDPETCFARSLRQRERFGWLVALEPALARLGPGGLAELVSARPEDSGLAALGRFLELEPGAEGLGVPAAALKAGAARVAAILAETELGQGDLAKEEPDKEGTP